MLYDKHVSAENFSQRKFGWENSISRKKISYYIKLMNLTCMLAYILQNALTFILFLSLYLIYLIHLAKTKKFWQDHRQSFVRLFHNISTSPIHCFLRFQVLPFSMRFNRVLRKMRMYLLLPTLGLLSNFT